MTENLSKKKELWSRHAMKEAVEDNFDAEEVEKHIGKSVFMDSGMGKQKAVCKVGNRFCTIIFVELPYGVKKITCWESSGWEIGVYKSEFGAT